MDTSWACYWQLIRKQLAWNISSLKTDGEARNESLLPLNSPPPPHPTSSQTHTHADACVWLQAAGENGLFQDWSVWTASLHGPTYQLQTAEGHIQTHSSYHWFKRKEPSVFPSRVLLFKQGWKSRCFNCICFQLSSVGFRSKNYTGIRYFHIILRLTHSACLNYLWNQTFRSMWRQYPVLLPYCLFSSLYSKYRALALSKTHMDYCVFHQIFEEGVRFSTWTVSRQRQAARLYCTHTHGTHAGNKEL